MIGAGEEELAAAPIRSRAELELGLDEVRAAPADAGALELIVRRPAIEQRELLDRGTLDRASGLVGDIWAERPTSSTPDRQPNPDAQVTVVCSRVAALVAAGEDHRRWALAGDQLFVDLDLGEENLPPGSRLGIGEAVLEVSAVPHTGCGKFARRFGVEALKLISSELGRTMRLRGLNARVLAPGAVAVGDSVRKLSAASDPFSPR